MIQTSLPFQYEIENKPENTTALGGLPLYLELMQVIGLRDIIIKRMQEHKTAQGWTDDQFIIDLILLNLAGGDCVEDLKKLEEDKGFCKVLRHVEFHGRTRSQKRELKKRWHKQRTRTVPSATSVREYLERFHNPDQEQYREPHKAFIPEPSELHKRLVQIQGDLVSAIYSRTPKSTATLDMDATLIETFKRSALFSYKKSKAYQPLNIFWADLEMMLFSEFRDGNVPAGYDLLRPFKETLQLVPAGVEKIFFRSDTAGYVIELLKYCAEGQNERFGVIEFAVGVDVTAAFRSAIREIPESDWHPLYRKKGDRLENTGQEYAEVCFVPSWSALKKNGPEYRFLAVREHLEQEIIPGLEDQVSLPFPTMDLNLIKYKITAIVTNRGIAADDIIWWYRERCGKSEEAHSIMKEDLAGGKLPSQLFGANAAWWQIMILAFNINSAMKRLALGGSWANRRMKAIRFWWINLPGRVLESARGLFVRLSGGYSSNELFDCLRRMHSVWSSG